jgi:pimeloyl-ACP methyl ester carboxylesterase
MSNVNHRHRVSAGQLSGIAFERRGTGRPLLLIHGTGGSRFVWQPIIDLLPRTRTLILIDLPGHGRSPSLPASDPHTPRHYAELLAGLLDALGIDRVDVCGHSSGGWTALELAKLGRARSVVAIAPAGLWSKQERRIRVLQLSAQYAILRTLAPLIPDLMRHARIRRTLMRHGMATPENLTAADAIEITRTFAATADLITHVRHTRRERFTGGQDLGASVTVAWCEQDPSRPAKTRLCNELPEATRYLTLPGCGHLAMWDEPDLVAETILEAIWNGPRLASPASSRAAPYPRQHKPAEIRGRRTSHLHDRAGAG